jgi:oligogalacturonide transport system permease protein
MTGNFIKRKNNQGYLYLVPWIIGFLVFQLYPLSMSFFYSFTNFSIGKRVILVGVQNYVEAFTKDTEMHNSLKVTFKYVFMAVPMKLTFALFVAMLLNLKVRGIKFFRTIYYLPSIMGGSVAVAILWRGIFAHSGALNLLLGLFNIKAVGWLTDTRVALFTISLLSVWQFGSSMVIFLAALKQVPQELYESASIDGMGAVGRFFTITIPLISPMILFNLVMQMINAFQEFTSAFVITGGGPLKSTNLYGILLYQNGFTFFKMGYASALSWIMFGIIIVFTSLVIRSSSYWTFYSDE